MMSLPGWNALHPLLVHFPIALLIVAPLLALVGLAFERQRAFLHAALILMILGTVGAWLAVGTGEAAGELAERLPGMEPLVERHEEMAKVAGMLFIALTVAYAALIFAPRALKWQPGRIGTAAHVVFLALYMSATVYLAEAAHQGAMLVHRYGVHAAVGQAGVVGEAARSEKERSGEDD